MRALNSEENVRYMDFETAKMLCVQDCVVGREAWYKKTAEPYCGCLEPETKYVYTAFSMGTPNPDIKDGYKTMWFRRNIDGELSILEIEDVQAKDWIILNDNRKEERHEDN